MSENGKLREQAAECRRLATAGIDAEIVRKLNALADEYLAKAVKAEAHASVPINR